MFQFASIVWGAAEVGDSAMNGGMFAIAFILAQVVMKLVERRGTANDRKKNSVPPPPKPETDPILVECHGMLRKSTETGVDLAHKVGETLHALKETQTYIREGTQNTLVTQTVLREWIVEEKARRDALRDSLRQTGEMVVPGYVRTPGGPV